MTKHESDSAGLNTQYSLVPPRSAKQPSHAVTGADINAAPVALQKDGGTKGILISAAAIVVAALLGMYSSIYMGWARIEFDDKTHAADLQRKDKELLLKQSEGQTLSAAERVKLMQYLADLTVSKTPDADLKLDALAKFELPIPDAPLILQNAKTVRRQMEERQARSAAITSVSSDEHQVVTSQPRDMGSNDPTAVPRVLMASEDPMAMGRIYTKAKDYENALHSFTQATLANPTDALAWNFKGFAEYSLHRFPEAVQSFNQGLLLKPQEEVTRVFLAINGTKVLCAQNRLLDAVKFFNESAAATPKLVSAARGDGQLQAECKAIWRT
ncbi:hypothetical protein I9H06_10345 [Pseudomonas tremae]|uniref:tetratricopeptide repeat protein n=1 Tax=Pseudomonas tremae TaxID=200454 RepID=UPI001F33D8FC|nr:hypothetical protein [Pseudomonas tremae]MCF5714656.1 hypothetical protein [Pseudomonas tremae]UQB33606.1 hypothetical protein I9H06_10345 [Pseudomonas tremae]